MIVTITGASGAGKTSYARELLRLPGWELVRSWTTRPPREKDLPNEYRHLTREEFDAYEFTQVSGFLWVVEHHGHKYGTWYRGVMNGLASARPRLMLVDPWAVRKLRDLDVSGRGMIHFYALSPDEAVLRQRLQKRVARDGISVDEIERRVVECRTWDAEALASDIPYVFVAAELSIQQAAALIEDRVNRDFGLTKKGT